MFSFGRNCQTGCHVAGAYHPPPVSEAFNPTGSLHADSCGGLRWWQMKGTLRGKDILGERSVMEARGDCEHVPLRSPA